MTVQIRKWSIFVGNKFPSQDSYTIYGSGDDKEVALNFAREVNKLAPLKHVFLAELIELEKK